jgi:NAD(P)-dependent dehydrogenase (short-subunit alcohol dehydrogenase family)
MTGTTDMFGLAGKTAIIWGGGQGMGESSAVYLGRAGCRLAVVDVSETRAEEAAAHRGSTRSGSSRTSPTKAMSNAPRSRPKLRSGLSISW